jgi:ABC-type siderophore export system fused ATPase/permease subunit
VTHDNRVFDLADRILDMEDGRIVSDRRPDKSRPLQQELQH